MFNYLFPIFCFGLVITGIVFLGIRHAAEQLKDELAERTRVQTLDRELNLTSSRSAQGPRSTLRNSRD